MIGPVYLFRAGCFALSGLGCGLAASLLRGRTIANWTWMASTMTFQRGFMVGSGLTVVFLCLGLFLRVIDKISWLTPSQKVLAKVSINYSILWLPPVIYVFSPFPVLSYLTFLIIANLSSHACRERPPFYCPSGWNSVNVSQPFKFRFERTEKGVVRQWIAYNEENYSGSLENYQIALLINHRNNGKAVKVLGPFTPSNDPGVLLEVIEPSQLGDALFRQLAIVKNGIAYTLVVGSFKAEFDQYAELFNQVLCSLRLGWDWSSTTEEKKQQLESLCTVKV